MTGSGIPMDGKVGWMFDDDGVDGFAVEVDKRQGLKLKIEIASYIGRATPLGFYSMIPMVTKAPGCINLVICFKVI